MGHINYDANGWFTLDLHESNPAGVEVRRTLITPARAAS